MCTLQVYDFNFQTIRSTHLLLHILLFNLLVNIKKPAAEADSLQSAEKKTEEASAPTDDGEREPLDEVAATLDVNEKNDKRE